MLIALIIITSYLLGSIPFGYLAGKLFKGLDIRRFGSGNIGFTNVKRTCGWPIALLVLALDIFKGAAPLIWLVPLLALPDDLVLIRILVGLAAVFGHIFPIWLEHLKGGKGVATTVGILIVLLPWGLLTALAIFLLVLLITKYVSLSSVLGSIGLSVYQLGDIILAKKYFFSSRVFWITCLVLMVLILVVYTHQSNIKKILKGQENKFSF